MNVIGFRPLSGIKVSEQKYRGPRAKRQLRFRPLSGIKVSEQMKNLPNINISGFRPLSGIKVSERRTYLLMYFRCRFPSPLGD